MTQSSSEDPRKEHHHAHPANVKKVVRSCPNDPREELSPEEEARISKNSTFYLILISSVLILTLLGLIFVPQYFREAKLESDKYNHFEFVQQADGFWYTVVNKGDQPYSIPFYYHPRDLEDVIVAENVRQKFFDVRDKGGMIYITLDPDSESNKIIIAGVEIARITGDRYGLLNVATKSAFTHPPSNASVNTATPIKTCNDADNRTLVVWLTVSNKNLVSAVGNCIVVEAKDYNETVRVADRLMYSLMGVMS